MSYEPPLEDDIALGKDEEEDDDGYQEPDRMWGDDQCHTGQLHRGQQP